MIKIFKNIFRIIIVPAVLLLFTLVVLFWIFVKTESNYHPKGTVKPEKYYPNLAIEKTTSGGTTYFINNSLATFILDIAEPDNHSDRLFKNYAEAIAYCKQKGLPVIPSVQVVQGKLKQFNDTLCATLETAVQTGKDMDIAGKRQSLKKLYSTIVKQFKLADKKTKPLIAEAAKYVAKALEKGGIKVGIPEKIAKCGSSSYNSGQFVTPCGFWNWNPELENTFSQDRFLMSGMELAENAPLAITIAAVIAQDPKLEEAFNAYNRFDAKLTNPPVYIKPGIVFALPEKCVLVSELIKDLPPGKNLDWILKPESVKKIKTSLLKKYGDKTGFALTAFSRSKEYDMLVKYYRSGGSPGNNTLDVIIGAITSGAVNLEPKPDSGWYDYQWYALETLILPDKAQERDKLFFNEKYAKRLKEAFKTILAKQRETQIKHLPLICLGGDGPEEKIFPDVIISPEFSVEPTATVYLRWARAYRFLRNALEAILSKKTLIALRRKNRTGKVIGENVFADLEKASLLCYGLYEILSPELGIPLKYLPDEMTKSQMVSARKIAGKWLANIAKDPDLKADTRIAVPVATDGASTQYWGTAGVYMEKAKYKYDIYPAVSKNVKPEFVPVYYYLPTDLSVEFTHATAETLTRERYRKICDKYSTVSGVRKRFKLRSYNRYLMLPYIIYVAVLIVTIIAFCIFLVKKRKVKKRNIPYVFCGLILLLMLFCVAVWFLCPGFRTKFLIRLAACREPEYAIVLVELSVRNPDNSVCQALTELLADPDPQIQYLSLMALDMASYYDLSNLNFFYNQTELFRNLCKLTLTNDDVVRYTTYYLISILKVPESMEFILSRLDDEKANTWVYENMFWYLGHLGNPKALDKIIPLMNDRRPTVRHAIINSLGKYKDKKAVKKLIEILNSDNANDLIYAAQAIDEYKFRDEGKFLKPWQSKIDSALLKASSNRKLSWKSRTKITDTIENDKTKCHALINILFCKIEPKNIEEKNLLINALGTIIVKKKYNQKILLPIIQKIYYAKNLKEKSFPLKEIQSYLEENSKENIGSSIFSNDGSKEEILGITENNQLLKEILNIK